MKKRLKVFSILLTLAFGIFNFANLKIFPTAKATYVEGYITQDTIWTLVDSPIVISKDIIVYPNATLTIEPGVKVKFGGAFSIIISGRLYANGLNKTITFTSNREQPEVGDWNTIKFNGTQKSTLTGCFIAYAKDGIHIENGDIEIEDSTVSFSQNGITMANGKLRMQNSTVSLCHRNGINATNSELIIQNTTIMENEGNGIYITGNGHTSLQLNTIIANGNGMLLTGNETSDVNISKNRISANKQNGVQIDANNHTDITIVNNIVSSNDKGFYISSPINVHLTNNSICYNEIGILYDEGSHTANYNDVYDNEMGMDVLSNATVNAEHNYWGDQSGPHHESLNPNGKGNPVGGDGVNLDFIFFLTKPNSYINVRPIANLLTDKIWVRPNEMVMFFATNSFDEGRIDRYFSDFGDGSTSGWTTLSIFTHKYSSLGTYYAKLTVMDDFGATSNTVTTTIYVQNLPQLNVNIELSDSAVQEEEQVSITVYVTNGTTAVENVTVNMFSVKRGEFTPPYGVTNASGYFITTFTAPDITEIANVRIIARATKNGIKYTDGSDHDYLEVIPFLSIQINAPKAIQSEETVQVIADVNSDKQPITNASLTISSDFGNIHPTTGSTDSNGTFSFIFTAPPTTETLNVTIRVIAAKDGYMDGVGQTVITIEPKILTVQVTAESNVTLSEAKLNVTVHVKHDIPVANANVTIIAEYGSFFTTTGLTDNYGEVTFIFTAPAVNEKYNITIAARATMPGCAEAQGQLEITVYPRTFNVEITAPTVKSEESATVLAHVTCKEDATSVADAIVRMSSSHGNFSAVTGVTDQNGYCSFIFNAPKTSLQLSAVIMANVTREGYVDGGNETTLTVTPESPAATEGGWPIITILLIVIPIAIAAIVIVLAKLGIIVISLREEEWR